MNYSVTLSDKAIKQLKKLNKVIAQRIIKKLKILKKDPCEKTLPVQDSNFRRLRVGDKRIIINVAEDVKKVLVVMLGKRENVYKELEKRSG